MRATIFAAVFLLVAAAGAARAQIAPEQVTVAKMAEPDARWLIIKNIFGPFHILDGETRSVKGVVSATDFTPALQPNMQRGELYAAETHFTRTYRGERTDVVTIYDATTLLPTGEVKIPNKVESLWFRHHIGLMGDGRHLAVFNMTPAQSISIVDVVDREFDGEISTPGCAMIMPTGDDAFLMICGDGTLQLIELNSRGAESNRVRSDVFFTIDGDPVFDKPVKGVDGWKLISYDGKIFDVTVQRSTINISDPWSLMNEKDIEESWRVGGGQPWTFHRASGLLYVLVHQGPIDTHHDAGTELWVFDSNKQRRVHRVQLEVPGTNVFATQDEEPVLYMINKKGQLEVRDPVELNIIQLIERPALRAGMLQSFGTYD
jgi:methylamine dehydrogenase heavy chain